MPAAHARRRVTAPRPFDLDEALLPEEIVQVVRRRYLGEAVVAEGHHHGGLEASQVAERGEEAAEERIHLGERPARLGAVDAVVVLEGVEGQEVQEQEPRGPHREDVARGLERQPVLHRAERVRGAPRSVPVNGKPLSASSAQSCGEA